MQQQVKRIYKNMALLAPDLLSYIVASRVDGRPRFFGAFHALTVDDGGCGTCFPCLFAAFRVRLVMDALQRAVAAP